MYISEIGDVVDAYQKICALDRQIDAARNGKVALSLPGFIMEDEDLKEQVGSVVVAYLRAHRAEIVRFLEKKGIQE
jgi:hypothetical protein